MRDLGDEKGILIICNTVEGDRTAARFVYKYDEVYFVLFRFLSSGLLFE